MQDDPNDAEADHLVLPPPKHTAQTGVPLFVVLVCLAGVFIAERRWGVVTRALAAARPHAEALYRWARAMARGNTVQSAAEIEKEGLNAASGGVLGSAAGGGSGDVEQGLAGKTDGPRRPLSSTSSADGVPVARALPTLTWTEPKEYAPLLSARDLRALLPHLPSRVLGRDMSLLFSTQRAFCVKSIASSAA